jgi:outer membrane immunogenic protein
MRRLLMASVAAVGLATGIGASAFAADLPIYTKAPPMAPYYNWTGFYAGVDVGYAWNDPTVTFTGNDPLSTALLDGTLASKFGIPGTAMGPIRFNDQGAFGGADVGYNSAWKRTSTCPPLKAREPLQTRLGNLLPTGHRRFRG